MQTRLCMQRHHFRRISGLSWRMTESCGALFCGKGTAGLIILVVGSQQLNNAVKLLDI
jgi:hypothetical protein